MKCKRCNGTGKVRGYFYEKTGVNKWEKVWGDSPCDECNGTGEIEMTNDEWRKTCSTEEFAKFILGLILHTGDTDWYDDLLFSPNNYDLEGCPTSVSVIESFLKEKHNE